MTFREKLADLISGGALTRARLLEAEENAQRRFWRSAAIGANAEKRRLKDREFRFSAALCQIRDMETPNANATVRRMAKFAREALE